MSTVQLSPVTARDPDIAGRRLLILGGGLWQREYVRAGRALGAEVWLTDWSPDAVARPDANHFAPIDLRDREGTLAFARQAGVEAVLTAADIGVPTAAHVSEALRLPGVPLELAIAATNKWVMRRRAQDLGLACPWFVHATDPVAALTAVDGRSYPVIVKPVDNCSSRGVQVVESAEALPGAVSAALQVSAAGDVLIEQFLVGREGSIEAMVQDGGLVILGICDKTKSQLPDRFDLELRYPGSYSDDVERRIREFTTTLVRGFGIRDAVLHIEFLVAEPDQRVFLIEFALRGCGSKVVTHLLPVLTGVDVVRAVIRQAFGLASDLRPTQSRHGILHFLMFPPGRITAIHGLAAARSVPGVIDLTVEPKAGEVITEVHDGRSRPGHLLAWSRTREAVQDVVRTVRETVCLEYEGGRRMSPIPLGEVAAS